MKKRWLLSAGMALILSVFLLVGCTPATSSSGGILSTQQEGIWVNGIGKVSVTPDLATLRLGVESQEVSVAQAQAKATDAMNRVRDALKNNGVSDKDIQTQSFNIYKVTRWDENSQREVVIGYRVSNIVMVKIRDIPKTGTIIDAVAVAGGDLTRIDSIGLSVDDPTEYQEDARVKAMADAEAKAKQLAKEGGVTLRKPTFISESTQTPSPIYPIRSELAFSAPAAAPAPISAGETEIIVSVQVIYEIQR